MNIFAIERDAAGGIDWIASAKSQDNHRVVKMILESTLAMLEEYTERFNRIHKCAGVVEKVIDLFDPNLFPSHDPSPLPLCMPDEFKTDDVVTSYRKFYASKPKMRYAKSKVPPWFSSFRTEKFELLP